MMPTHVTMRASAKQLHKEPTKQNFDDLRDAVTKSASGRAEMGLEEVFVLALQFIKQVKGRNSKGMRNFATCLPSSVYHVQLSEARVRRETHGSHQTQCPRRKALRPRVRHSGS